jgi:hypothetical protein
MRILILAAWLGAGLFAQTPPSKPAEQGTDPSAQWKETRQALQSLRNFASNLRAGLPESRSNSLTFDVRRPGVMAPGKACAIPLLNAMPKGGFTGDPKMVIPGSEKPSNIDHMPILLEAPSCADFKR